MAETNRDIIKKGSSVISAVPHENFPFLPVDEHIFTYLLCRFYFDLGPGVIHVVPIRDILEYARLDRASKLHESLRRMAEGVIMLDYHNADGERRTIYTHYLSADASHSENGMLHFSFDTLLVPFLTEPKVYAVINKRTQLRLKNWPALKLFEYMTLAIRMREPVWNVSIDELRNRFRVGQKHPRYDNFRRNVLEKAIAEVNAVAEFDVILDEPVLGGAGGKVQSVVFRAVPKSHGRILEASSLRSVGSARKRPADKHTVDLLDGMTFEERGGFAELTPEGMELARAAMPPGADLNVLLADWRDTHRGQAFTDPDKAFATYVAMMALRENDPVLKNIEDDVFGALLSGG